MALTTLWYSTYPGFQALVVIHALYGFFSIVTFWSPYLKAIRSLGSESEQGQLNGRQNNFRGMEYFYKETPLGSHNWSAQRELC